jgi:signal transduction histidine kinase
MKSLLRKKLLRPAVSRQGMAMPLLILVVTAVLATLVVLQDLEETSQLVQAIHDENELRMQSCCEHVVDYFDVVYSTLLFVSLDNDVVAMRRDSRDYIQKMYDHQWEAHRLTEIYVIQRDFRGDEKPFMSFERGSEGESVAEIHSLEREQEEYRAQIDHLRRFEADPGLKAILSDQLRLCTPGDRGGSELGYVYSVPIRSDGKLVGMVAGMIRRQTILQLLRHGSSHQTALLVNETGDIQGDGHSDPAVINWFQRQFAAGGANAFFAKARTTLEVENKTAVWKVAEFPSTKRWWLIYIYNQADEIHATRFPGFFGHLLMASCLFLAGSSVAVLVWTLGQRLVENRLHLQERKQLEWQVQEVSERIQRRIGGNLHEDLCQRLTGISAISATLTRKLEALKAPEAQLASEITREIRESLAGALHMADELQQVSLLQHGFLAAIKELAMRTEERSGIPCSFEDDATNVELEISVATQLFRIVQEAVLNAVRHAESSHLVIGLSVIRNQLTVTVSDDGIGDAQKLLREPGLGLRIMRYRSDLIGAQLEILPAQTKGVVVRCSCPVAKPKDSAHTRQSASS